LIILLIDEVSEIVWTSLCDFLHEVIQQEPQWLPDLGENLLREVDRGVFEACRALGATTRQTVLWALLPETLTGLLAAITVTAPTRDALFIEGADSPYANLVAARPDNVNSPAILKLVAALRSPEAKKFVKDTYHGAVLTTF